MSVAAPPQQMGANADDLVVHGAAHGNAPLLLRQRQPRARLLSSGGALAEFEAKYGADLADFSALRRHFNHSDYLLDNFPLAMTQEMHKRVLKLRKLLRKQDNDLEAIRGTRPVGGLSLIHI